VDAVLFSAAVAQREVVAGNARTLHDLTDPADWPGGSWDVWDILNVPTSDDPGVTVPQRVRAVTVNVDAPTVNVTNDVLPAPVTVVTDDSGPTTKSVKLKVGDKVVTGTITES
jgi:hypothetical protein